MLGVLFVWFEFLWISPDSEFWLSFRFALIECVCNAYSIGISGCVQGNSQIGLHFSIQVLHGQFCTSNKHDW